MEKISKKKEKKEKNLKSQFLPPCGEEWISSVFNEYTVCSPLISGPQDLDFNCHSWCCPFSQGLSLGPCLSLG
jgi:hypothetical protein